MTLRIDLNADVGEHDGPPPPDLLSLLSAVTSANIACAGHAGDPVSMRETMAACRAAGVQIGAHPSYPDRDGFGRRFLALTPEAIADSVAGQIGVLADLAAGLGVAVDHVKPHGALYNTAWQDAAVARAIVDGIGRVLPRCLLYAPPGSRLEEAGLAGGLRVVAEGFLDRAYEPDGTLTPRSEPDAVLHDVAAAIARATTWVTTGTVVDRTGTRHVLPVGTLCVHGDTPDAAAIASQVRAALERDGIAVRAVHAS